MARERDDCLKANLVGVVDDICGGSSSKNILDYTDDATFERRAEDPTEEFWLVFYVASTIKGVVEDSLGIN